MSFILGFFPFWYDFIIGDDWTVAAAVAAALIVIILLTQVHVNAWWLLPIVVAGVLGLSTWRVTAAAQT